jgi:hypothetical protein
MFLFLEDYDKLLTTEDFDTVLNNNDALRLQTEVTAQGFISQYIRQRYDVTKIFKEWTTWTISKVFAIGDYFKYTETAFSATSTYTTGQRVSYLGYIYSAKTNLSAGVWLDANWTQICLDKMIYTCIVAGTSHYPENTIYFTQSDPRDSEIVKAMTITTIYNMQAQIVPGNIPIVWRILFDKDGQWRKMDGSVIGTLVAWQFGDLMPNLPIYTDDQQGQNITWGSNMKRNNTY